MKKQLFTLIMFLSIVSIAIAQRTITGVISAESGDPLVGASVVVKGSSVGTVTDVDGKFSLAVPKDAKTLVASFVGFISQELTIGTTNELNIKLVEGQLQEVVVTAQGIRKNQREIGYSYSKVATEELTVGRSPQLAQALAGKITGLAVYNVNNSVDPAVKVVLRGYRSLTGNNEALIVVDGMQTTSTVLALINPNDIENVTVLKGGQAATLYGSAGINGAIVITTKKGENTNGKIKVQYSNSTNIEQISFLPSFQDKFGSGSQYYPEVFGTPAYNSDYLVRMKANWRPFENQQYGDAYDGSQRIMGRVLESGNKLIIPYSAIPNIREKTFDQGVSTNNQFSVQGGDETSSFYLSVENQLIKGIVPNDKSDRTGVRLSATKGYDKFQAVFSLGYTQANYDRTGADFYSEVLNQPANLPLNTLRDWKTNEFANPNGYYNDYLNNPYFVADNNRLNYRDANIIGNFNLSYKATEWLQISNRIGVMNNSRTGKNTIGKFIYTDYAKNDAFVPAPWDYANDYDGIDRAGSDILGSVFDYSATENVINNEFQIQLTKDFESVTNKLILGSSIFQRTTKGIGVGSNTVVVPDIYNINNRQGELIGNEANTQSRKYGYYADLTSNFKNWLIFNGTVRYDATSLFYGPGRNKDLWAYAYYGAAVSLIATDAIPALKSNILNYAKIRVNYNRNANDNVPLYGLSPIFTSGNNFPYGNTVGLSQGNVLPDENLKPETVYSSEIGGEFVLFNNRITIDGSVYNQTSKDQAITVKVPNTTGFPNLLINVGETRNFGYEVDMKYLIVRTPNFKWDFGIRYSYNDNEVISLYPGITEFQYGGGLAYANTNVKVGERFPLLKTDGYRYSPENDGRVLVNGTTGYPLRDASLSQRGGTLPRHIAGLGSKISYAGFAFNFNFEYRGGNVMFSDLGRQMTFTGAGGWTSKREPHIYPNSSILSADGKTSTPNTTINVREPEYALWVNNYRLISENFVNDAWFIKLRDINLSYTVPKSIISKSKIFSSASIAIYGRNLLTIVDKLNFYTDPEFSSLASATSVTGNNIGNLGNAGSGNGLGINTTTQTPPVRQFGINLNLSF
jgi:TonB-linked SusC/RagA family outer membrane protein